MANVYMHGSLGKKYGKKFYCAVPTGKQCMQLLLAQLKGLHKDLSEGYFRFNVCGKDIQAESENKLIEKVIMSLVGPVGNDDEIHITPAIQGSGSNGGIFMVVAGVVAIGAAFFTGGASIAAWSATVAAVAATGAMMVVGGMAMMLTKMPSTTAAKTGTANEEKSTGFSSLENMAGQGQAIALIYGRNKVGSSVVSQQIQTLTRGIN